MTLRIEAEWEGLSTGPPEERACFAAVGIVSEGEWLTEARDSFARSTREKVYLSAYRLAEWLAWNWWRLSFEARGGNRSDWAYAHRLATIGAGYVWPDITIVSDGERIALIARPTKRSPFEPLRYLSSATVALPRGEFEAAVASYLEQVLARLDAESIRGTNLQQVWADLSVERSDPEVTRLRRLEAALGRDPDEGPEHAIERLQAEVAEIGMDAAMELAATRTETDAALALESLREQAPHGHESRLADMASLAVDAGPLMDAERPAWSCGAEAARRLRVQESLGDEPMPNQRLAELAAVPKEALEVVGTGPISFALSDGGDQTARVVLRETRWRTGRRFDLARLLGDRLLVADKRLSPCTRSFTYRQKWQRAFAAELLCPFVALEAMLGGDYSIEALETAAARYEVSDLAVRTMLVNNRRLERSNLEDAAGAA